MKDTTWRTRSLYCLVIWAAIWLIFLLIRYSSVDIRVIPGIGPVMLGALIGSMVTPIAATVFAAAAVIRQSRAPLNWLVFGCAIIGTLVQIQLFMSSKWL